MENVPKPVYYKKWCYFLYRLSAEKNHYLSYLLKGPTAKLCENKIIIRTMDTSTGIKLDSADSERLITNMAKEVLGVEIDKMHVIAYSDHTPCPEYMP